MIDSGALRHNRSAILPSLENRDSSHPDPSLGGEDIPGQGDLPRFESLLALVPCVDETGCDPMDGGKQLEAEGALETLDESGDPLEARSRLRQAGEAALCGGHGRWQGLYALGRTVAPIGVA